MFDLLFFCSVVQRMGFLVNRIFGSSLETGDYGYLLIDHAHMLMRRFLSMTQFSQQGFEASHKDQRQLWLKASSHDHDGEASSSELTFKQIPSYTVNWLLQCKYTSLQLYMG